MKTVVFLCSILVGNAWAMQERDRKQVAVFRRANPCPATGKTTGPCKGWVVDHVWSLCLGGPDVPQNMKWQTTTESYLKDVFEREMCDMKRKLEVKATPSP